MEKGTDIPLGKWVTPECPLEIEFSPRVLDDIRLAVVDAFFSLPRGGAEIGGILLGKHGGNVVSITDFEPLNCEHAYGPSFTLSPKDQTALAELTARAKRNPYDRQPVGWYHSHTRSEIFLSEKDQDIHKLYFPEPWQVALVLKPHTFEPTRGGFFFREADGIIRGSASYREFLLEPLPMRPSPPSATPPAARFRPLREEVAPREPAPSENGESAEATGEPGAKRQVPITREIPDAGDLGKADSAKSKQIPETQEFDAPKFTQAAPRESRRALVALACVAVGLAVGAGAYQTRQSWLPQTMGKFNPVLPQTQDTNLSLAVTDDNGQLKIQWDRNAPAIRNATGATLEITDGSRTPRLIVMDGPHLATGNFTYGRESERVDVALTASQTNGKNVREQTSYLGKLPEKRADEVELQKERDAMAETANKLQKDLSVQASKTRRLEKDLKEMHDQIEQRRMVNQTGEPTKKE